MKKNDDDKSKTLIRFGLYMLFLFIVIAMIITTGVKPKNNLTNVVDDKVVNTKKTYLEKKQGLFNGDYEYKFVIDDGEITYEGTFIDGIRKGIKKTKDEETEYIEKSYTYIIQNGKEIIYDNLYEGLDNKLFNFRELFDILDKENCIIDAREEETVYSYENIFEYNFNIITDQDNVIKIEIYGTHNYIFSFTY